MDQNDAVAALHSADKTGILCDALAVYLLRRLELTDIVQQAFGKVGVTQNTIDIFARRLQEAETMGSYFDDGRKRSAQMSLRDGKLILSEMSEEEIDAKVKLLRADLDWVSGSCEVVPAVAREDPPDWVLRLRSQKAGNFLEDLLACDGSGRVLISDDLPLRQWGSGLFQTRSAWLQAMLFHLEKVQNVSTRKVVTATVQLLEAGEHALSINTYRLLVAAEMVVDGELAVTEFEALLAIIGQRGAAMRSHAGVAAGLIDGLWSIGALSAIKQRSTSVALRNLIRNQGGNGRIVIDAVLSRITSRSAREYIATWRVGHFT